AKVRWWRRRCSSSTCPIWVARVDFKRRAWNHSPSSPLRETDPMRILLLAALDEEAEAFRPGEGIALDGAGLPARRMTIERHDVILATTGIGKVNMAVAAARLHTLHAPQLLLTLGTAGKL